MVAWLTRIDRSQLFVTPALRLRVPSSERNWATDASSRSGARGRRGGAAGRSAEQPARHGQRHHGSREHVAGADARRTLASALPPLSPPDLRRYGYGGDTPVRVVFGYLICEIKCPMTDDYLAGSAT